jgi:IclR family pca regulon transcriptional regulator
MTHALGETSNLQELDGHEIVFLARFPGRHLVNVDFAVGSRLPALFTASGRAMLSKLDAAGRREIIRATPLVPVTPQTEVDPKVLLQRIDEAARQGYAIVQNQTVVGDISVAAAITDHDGRPSARSTSRCRRRAGRSSARRSSCCRTCCSRRPRSRRPRAAAAERGRP